ncbi:hypothetical protein BC941DRAFT_429044 [Chlamydoabsidia padenii]|nr:hypothetical protein BC941DRAFT_429044 [Chlamydoabsidia padenii]
MSTLAIYGGAGGLGRSLVTYFKSKGFRIINIDLVENKEADVNSLNQCQSYFGRTRSANQTQSLDSILGGNKLAGIFCLLVDGLVETQQAKWGLLSLTGALAALNATPGMIGYDLAASNGGLPQDAKVITLCPVTIDTPMNRQFMPDADFSTWTSPEDIAK